MNQTGEIHTGPCPPSSPANSCNARRLSKRTVHKCIHARSVVLAAGRHFPASRTSTRCEQTRNKPDLAIGSQVGLVVALQHRNERKHVLRREERILARRLLQAQSSTAALESKREPNADAIAPDRGPTEDRYGQKRSADSARVQLERARTGKCSNWETIRYCLFKPACSKPSRAQAGCSTHRQGPATRSAMKMSQTTSKPKQ